MKNKYVLFILFWVMMVLVPSRVKASYTCNYSGKSGSVIERANANDKTNDQIYTVIIDNVDKFVSIPGFKTWDSEKDYGTCSTSIYNLALVSSVKSGSGYGGSGGSGGETKTPEVVNCEYLFGDPDDSRFTAYWLQWVLNLMKYLGIIALFIMSTVDFVKALVQHDQDALKKAATTSVKRFIFCILLFFLPIIVDTLMSFLGAYGTCNIG